MLKPTYKDIATLIDKSEASIKGYLETYTDVE